MSGHDAITLYQSFNSPFLLMTNQGSYLQKAASHQRAKTTLDTEPPKIWFPISATYYADLALAELKRHDIVKALSRSYLPSPESPISLASESDVVRAAALWFLHPVIKAMQAIVPGAKCAAEVVDIGVRCDVLITVNGSNVAVLEYKNRGYLSRNDFMRAYVADSTERNAREVISKTTAGFEIDQDGWRTQLGGNSVILTKQAAAYATRFGTKYIALFDWDSLFLWDFAGMKIYGKGAAKQGDWAYGTWVEGRDRFRVVLLGFFLRAYHARRDKGSRYNDRSWSPWVPTPAQQERRRQEYDAQQRQKMGSKNVDAYGRRWQ